MSSLKLQQEKQDWSVKKIIKRIDGIGCKIECVRHPRLDLGSREFK